LYIEPEGESMEDELIPWGKLTLQNSRKHIKLPYNQSFDIERNGNEIYVKRMISGVSSSNRFITGDDLSLYLEPGLPDLPMILNPVESLSILPGKKIDVYVEVIKRGIPVSTVSCQSAINLPKIWSLKE
jgi:hypothetical protein